MVCGKDNGARLQFVAKQAAHFQVFEEEASSWEEKLNRILALFDVWIDVQRR